MRLLEHEAKQLLSHSGVTIPNSELLRTPSDIPTLFPTVIKAQVLTGRRNKFGGVKIVHEQAALATTLQSVFAANIDGYMPESVLAEELLDIKQEFYLNLSVNRDEQAVVLLAHRDGGVDIESQPKDAFFREVIDNDSKSRALRLAEYFGLESHEFALGELLDQLLDCLKKNDALSLEVNPLVVTKAGELVAADCKMELDNAATFRHPDWNFYDIPLSANFVELNLRGTVATIANGAGLAMATVDAVQAAGYTPANFLDIGGGASKETVMAAFHELMKYSELEAIVINIFAGITRCDEVARAIIAAREEIKGLPALKIRLEGTNVAEAHTLLSEHSIVLYESLDAAIGAINA
ncbi:hypothetical protein I8H83_03530 [Candidatus Saccharibacteria bacterium]|nr:hypothetical protein [Candidatus Saccharibacteria bacterium]